MLYFHDNCPNSRFIGSISKTNINPHQANSSDQIWTECFILTLNGFDQRMQDDLSPFQNKWPLNILLDELK